MYLGNNNLSICNMLTYLQVRFKIATNFVISAFQQRQLACASHYDIAAAVHYKLAGLVLPTVSATRKYR